MAIRDALLSDYDHELGTTRRLPERLLTPHGRPGAAIYGPSADEGE